MIRNPPLDAVRAACAHLLGPCYFLLSCPLLPSLAPSPSCCCWPPLAFSLPVPVHTRATMARNSVFKWSIFAFLVSCCFLFVVFWPLFLFCWCVLLLCLLSANSCHTVYLSCFSPLLSNSAQLRSSFLVLVHLSADWTGTRYLLFLLLFLLRYCNIVLVYLSADWTGAPVPLVTTAVCP